MKRRKHTTDQVVRKLREADRLLAEGREIPEVTKHLEISEQTYHRWRKQYGGLKADDAKLLKELSKENTHLKRIVADKELEIDALKEIANRAAIAPPRLWPIRTGGDGQVAPSRSPSHFSTRFSSSAPSGTSEVP